ncbi:MAG: membrane protein insertion efficiency factor YidD [Acidimicrobiales bacterium]
MTGLRRAIQAPIRLYQRLSAHRPPSCRFAPSCSTYALEALEHHGAVRGLGYSARRIARCHPWGGQGWDPVPPTHQVKV